MYVIENEQGRIFRATGGILIHHQVFPKELTRSVKAASHGIEPEIEAALLTLRSIKAA